MLTTASSGCVRRAPALLAPALVVLATACALVAGAVVLAGPAAAIEDPRRPAADLTHGPSCGLGAVRVSVTNGSVPHRVALVFDGTEEQDSVVLADGEQAELVSRDVDWGRTVEVSLAVTDAAGVAEDPVEFGSYTRPAAADCAAISGGSRSAPATPSAASSGPAPAPDEGAPSDPAGSASAASISPGGIVTVRATGFTPGERVTVSLLGVDEPLTTVTAGGDGSVQAVVQIPRTAAIGTATVRLVGGLSSASAGLRLQVAARARPAAEPAGSVPVGSAGVALVAGAGMLGLVAARRSRGEHPSSHR